MSKRCFDALNSFSNATAYLWRFDLIFPPLVYINKFFFKYLTLKERNRVKKKRSFLLAGLLYVPLYLYNINVWTYRTLCAWWNFEPTSENEEVQTNKLIGNLFVFI